MSGRSNLLIVDDSKYLAERLVLRTNQGGIFNPVVAHCYEELKELLNSDFQLFAGVVDLILPDCADGEAVSLALKHNIPTIALTGSLDENLRNMIISKPIVDFIIKGSQEDIYSAVSLAEHIHGFKGKKVLIIDNSSTRTKYLAKFFSELLFEVITADTAEYAFEILKSVEDIEVITVNNERSDMSGSDIVKTIRQNPIIRHSMKNRNVVIFGISVDSMDFLRSIFIKCGANDLISLPITKEEFNAKILNNLNMMHTLVELKEKNEKLIETVKILEEYNKAVDAGGIVSKGDLDGNITYVNDAFCELTGYSRDELVGMPHNLFRHPSTPKAVFREMWTTIQAGNVWMGNVKNVRKDGSHFYVGTTIIPIVGNDGAIVEYVATRQDITELVKSRKELKKQFQTDPLTSLGNRTRMLSDLTGVEEPLIAVFDIDRFYDINGFYGNEVGDLVLKEMGNRLFDYFSESIFSVYRINSDQFAVTVSSSKLRKSEFVKQMNDYSKVIHNNAFKVNDIDVDISLTMCLVDDKDDVLTKVDMTLKAAKQGKKPIVVYEHNAMCETEAYKNNILWTKIIKHALKFNNVIPYYQPIVDNQNKKIVKYESLMRIIHDGKVITPAYFMDIAKRTRYYQGLTSAMMRKSFHLFSKNRSHMTINISVEDVANRDTMNNIYELLEAYMIGNRITFEIVESEGIENYEEVYDFINRVKDAGCKVAIDDFGSGYSNFEYLMKLKADYIKIDGSIVRNATEDESAIAVIEAIVSFAKKNGMKTIAEFVSSESTYEKMVDLGVDYSQGYLFGKPSAKLKK